VYEPAFTIFIEPITGRFLIIPLSLKIAVYKRTDNNGVTEYALVNKGTTPSNLLNWVNNALGLDGKSLDALFSISFAIGFQNKHGGREGAEITMIGHSKGGGEAIYNAIATTTNCITFNPAPTDITAYFLLEKQKEYRTELAAGTRTMVHHIVQGEILNSLFGNPVIGTVNPISTQFYISVPVFVLVPVPFSSIFIPVIVGVVYVPDPIQNHSMKAIKKAWGL